MHQSSQRTVPRACRLLLVASVLSISMSPDTSWTQDDPKASWDTIAPYLSPPPEWEGKLGDYRSPLQFADGSPVKTPADWQKRRTEILEQWHGLMGKWPPLITNPEVEILERSRRENFEQLKIRFLWTPEEQTTGYLLIPEGTSPRPAVVTVYYEPETAIGEGKEYRDFAYQLAKRGFVTLSLGTTEATAAKTYALYYPDIDHAKVQPLSMLAYAAANACTSWPNAPKSTRHASVSSAIPSAGSGPCSRRACSTSSLAAYGPTRALSSTHVPA